MQEIVDQMEVGYLVLILKIMVCQVHKIMEEKEIMVLMEKKIYNTTDVCSVKLIIHNIFTLMVESVE